jgi:hypothetical protein
MGTLYFPCPHKAKYKIKYKLATSGAVTEKNLCGKHFSVLRKNAERIFKRTGFDSEIKFEIL